MGIVNGSLELGYKNAAWFAANPTLVLKEGQIVYLLQTGTYKIGNGVSTLSALSFLGISSETQTLQNVTDLGATTTNSITANSFIKSGGTSSQFLKANGSVDSFTYATTTYVDSQDALKVDKVTGKGLSTNDYTTAEQTKLSGIATGAEVNVNADWNATSGDAQILNKPTIPSITGLVPYTGATNDVNLGTNNISANNFFDGFTSVTASVTQIVLTISSTPSYLVTGSGGQTIKMPNATTLPNGAIYYFNNNQSSGAILVNNNSNTLIKSVASGSLMILELTDNSTAAGSWDAHFQAPSNVTWSTNTFDYTGSITSATWNGVSIADNRIASASTWNAKQDALSGTGFVKSTAGVISYDTNTYLTTSSASSTYVPYTGATANVNLGTQTLTTPTINGVSGLLSFGSTDRVNVGNYATPLSQRAFTVGQDTAWVTIGSIPGATTYGGIWFNQTSQTSNNAALYGISTATTLQSSNILYLRALGTNMITLNQSNISFTPGSFASGVAQSFTFTNPNNTNQTLSTSIAGWNYNGGTRQWATGAITTQSENVWGATTYSFVAASTITNAYGNVFNAPIAGTNATITNNYSAQFNGKVEANLGLETNTLAGLNTAGANLLIVSNNTATKGYILIGNNSAETVYIQSQQFGFSSTVFFTPLSATGFSISRVTPSDTIPNFVMNRSDLGTGIGGTINTISLITASTTKVKLFNNGNLLIQSGGTFTDNGFKVDVNGTGRFQDTLIVTNKLIAGFNTTPRTGTISDGVTSVLGNLQNFTTNYHSGEVLYSEVSGEALNFGQLCYRNAAGKWQKATGSSSTIAAYNMLGICLQTVAGTDTAISILTRGYVETTYLSAGAVGNPLFMSAATAGSITNTAPSTAGNIVRVIGNVFWSSALQTNAKWILYFNPDNTWIEL